MAELDNFLQSDMSDQKLVKKYENIIKLAQEEENNVQQATILINEEAEKGILTESRCLDIIHQYNKHANVGRLYEMVVNYIKANNL